MVKDGDLTAKQRNALLAEMTDEVAALVLRDNYEQNLAIANAVAHAPSLLHVHEDFMRRLEQAGTLDREIEGLPSRREVRRRLDRGRGLTPPELAVLMAWTKIVLADELLAGDLPDDPYLDLDLKAYFPTPMREQFRAQIEAHPLRREIIVTQVVNDLVNGAGMTYWPRLADETGATVADLTRANFVAREIYASLPLRDELKSYDNQLDARVQTSMRIQMRTLVERASRWLVNNRRPPLDSQGTVDQFAGPVQATMAQLPELMTGRELEAYQERQASYERRGVPEELARRVAVLEPAYMLLGLVEVAQREELAPEDVARVHFALGERLGLPVLLQRIVGPAARRQVADDGPRRAPRRPARRAHRAHRAGAAHHVARRLRPGPHRGLGGGRRRAGAPGRRDAGADLRRRGGRPRPDVGRAAGGARAACRLTGGLGTQPRARRAQGVPVDRVHERVGVPVHQPPLRARRGGRPSVTRSDQSCSGSSPTAHAAARRPPARRGRR